MPVALVTARMLRRPALLWLALSLTAGAAGAQAPAPARPSPVMNAMIRGAKAHPSTVDTSTIVTRGNRVRLLAGPREIGESHYQTVRGATRESVADYYIVEEGSWQARQLKKGHLESGKPLHVI